MKPTAIYIPEIGKTFFIDEIISITDIIFLNPADYDFTAAYFEIQFKNKKKIKIKNFKLYEYEGDEGDGYNYCKEKFDFKIIINIRNQFLQHTNIINAQETDKEQVIFPKYLVMQHSYPAAFVVRKKDFIDYDSKDELEFIPIKIGSIS